ncbi:MAG: BatA domain-containing protein, partial [Candidatus Neomarinimicrobiota bacterium]|nr:BatA domain-containing protein [Candidatus Neomarinimicrobiota bacterium]
MTFLTPSVLWLLGAVSIPILIHLLSRLRINKVEFSTVRFIKQLETSSIRKMEIQKILLLLLRILALASLVLMMAQPVTQGFMPGWLAAEQEARLVMIIDNSASMTVKDGEKTFLDRSKNETMALVPLFKDETQITIAQTCPPKVVFTGRSKDPGLRSSVKSIEPSASYDNIWQSINGLLRDKTIIEPIKECVIFSDLMHVPDSSFSSGIEDLDDWKFYFIQPGIVYDNLAVKDVS